MWCVRPMSFVTIGSHPHFIMFVDSYLTCMTWFNVSSVLGFNVLVIWPFAYPFHIETFIFCFLILFVICFWHTHLWCFAVPYHLHFSNGYKIACMVADSVWKTSLSMIPTGHLLLNWSGVGFWDGPFWSGKFTLGLILVQWGTFLKFQILVLKTWRVSITFYKTQIGTFSVGGKWSVLIRG